MFMVRDEQERGALDRARVYVGATVVSNSVAHLYMLEDAKALVGAGLDIIGHAVRDQDIDQDFIAELKRRNVAYIPTLTRDLAVFEYETTPAYFSDPFFLRGRLEPMSTN